MQASTQCTLSLTLIELMKQTDTPELELEYWQDVIIPGMNIDQKKDLINRLSQTIQKQARITKRSLSLLNGQRN